jgi:hypothetical protein
MHRHPQLRLWRPRTVRQEPLQCRLLHPEWQLRVPASACGLLRGVRWLQLQRCSQRSRPLSPSHILALRRRQEQQHMQGVSRRQLLSRCRRGQSQAVHSRHLLSRYRGDILQSLPHGSVLSKSRVAVMRQLLCRNVLSCRRIAAMSLPHQLVCAPSWWCQRLHALPWSSCTHHGAERVRD